MAKVKAVIDIGTNTFNLIIASVDEKVEMLFSTKEPVKLGKGGMTSGLILHDAMLRAQNCLRNFFKYTEEYQVEDVRLIATSAMRNASNANDLIQFAKNEFNWDVEIVSGQREFELIKIGVAQTIDFTEPSLIMDIGGGSLELIYLENNQIVQAESFECGVARMFEWQSLKNPMTKCEEAYLEEKLESFIQSFLSNISPVQFIGASGSFETFYEMIHQTNIKKGFLLTELSKKDVLNACDYLIHSTYEERLANIHIDKVRKLMAPLAAVQLNMVLKNPTIERFYISEYSLKEGVLFE
jgi:exopolyphosphatase/guanosine-5'-triphosphate,3'-diphosphate pyrophosphatase